MKRKTILIVQIPISYPAQGWAEALKVIKKKVGKNCEVITARTLKGGEAFQFYSFEVTEDGTRRTQNNG